MSEERKIKEYKAEIPSDPSFNMEVHVSITDSSKYKATLVYERSFKPSPPSKNPGESGSEDTDKVEFYAETENEVYKRMEGFLKDKYPDIKLTEK